MAITCGWFERRRRLRLLDETHQSARIAHDFRRQDFQRDGPAEDGVTRAIDVAHPALTDECFDLILPERRIDQIGPAIHGARILGAFHSDRFGRVGARAHTGPRSALERRCAPHELETAAVLAELRVIDDVWMFDVKAFRGTSEAREMRGGSRKPINRTAFLDSQKARTQRSMPSSTSRDVLAGMN